MSPVLNRISLNQKLILLAAIPMLLFLIFGSLRMFDLVMQYQIAQRHAIGVSVSRLVEAVIFDIQVERTLSAGYMSGNGDDRYQQLVSQREATDSDLQALLDSPFLADLPQLANSQTSAKANLQHNIQQLKLMRGRLVNARQWVDSQSEQLFFSFYNKFNQHLFALIAQLQILSQDIEQQQAYGNLLSILKFQELMAKERGLMNQFISADYIDVKAYMGVSEIEKNLNVALDDVLLNASPQYRSLIQKSLDNQFTHRLQTMRDDIRGQVQLVSMANQLSAVLGYGGLIHSFENYLLRGEEQYLDRFNAAMQQIGTILDSRSSLVPLSVGQSNSIGQLLAGIQQYQQNLDKLFLLKEQGVSLARQDSLVRIDDSLIITALSKLQQQAPSVSAELWWQVSSEAMDQLSRLNSQLTDDIAQIGEKQKREALTYLLLGIVVGLVNFLLLIFMGRYVVNNLSDRISTISNLMHRMSCDTNLQLTVPVDGNDEVAKMSMALNRMLTERLKAHCQLNLASAVFEHCAEGIVVTDKDNLIEAVNPAFSDITGYSFDEVKGRSPSVLSSNHQPAHFYQHMWESLSKQGKWQGEIWNKRKNGQIYPEYLAITVVKNDEGRVIQHIGLFLDISNRKKYEKDLWYKTNYDALTNLPGRELYHVRLSQMLQLAEQACCAIAVLFIDLDRFKYINDIYGHATGDELLRIVAARLESLLEQHDFVARLSGDEFVVVIGHTEHQGRIESRTNEILQHLSAPFGINRNDLLISASIGISCYPDNGSDVESLTRNAETAMYQAKQEGRNGFSFFSADMNTSMLARVSLEQALRRAVLQNEFCLHYQPIINTLTGQVVAVEALIRWQDPKNGLVSPDRFIPIAEETGLIEPIGEWVLNQALSDLREWHDKGYMINMAINVSGRQLVKSKDNHFACLLNGLLQKFGVPSQSLHIEITESMLMDDTEKSLNALNSIRSLGIEIYLDDFGTGYSSLSYLKRFPISVIKIDKSFVDNMLDEPADANLIKAIITMGQSLDMKLVAEGVEDESQLQFLQKLGCDYTQGYLVSRPLESDDLQVFLAENGARQLEECELSCEPI
ncbi:EAL domain-containing protein [Shewanella psychrotolerans]|uniref:EAL domain-containing protein n=1 Tax=Shewanella psychrotolerans TaxID=2864206 RepID=UPI001C65D3E9|nr:EAL domain-containing protein [Shewanella psychrotolerans]QYK01462.1 EAL domain-containing protein [Shewanella psychrotolerans]